MIRFDEQKQIESVEGALALRPKIESIVDECQGEGFKNLCYIGIGGTWASGLQAVCHLKEYTENEVFCLNAAEYLATGDKRVGEGTVMVFSSVTGTTVEIVEAVKKAKKDKAKVIGFIDKADCELVKMVDYCITYPANEQLKFFMVADRFLKIWGERDDYDLLYKELELYLPKGLVEVAKKADSFGEEFANKHHKDPMHYFLGAGALYGATYSYAMCFWEEQHWLRSKSIHSAEFFHGMLEIVDRDTPVTVFIGEDSQRNVGLRVEKFLPNICDNYTIIDTKDYPIEGLSEKFRGDISHLIMRTVTGRIDCYIEKLNNHDMSIRRYYRKFEY